MIAHLDTFSEYTMKDTKIKKNKDTHTHKKKKKQKEKSECFRVGGKKKTQESQIKRK